MIEGPRNVTHITPCNISYPKASLGLGDRALKASSEQGWKKREAIMAWAFVQKAQRENPLPVVMVAAGDDVATGPELLRGGYRESWLWNVDASQFTNRSIPEHRGQQREEAYKALDPIKPR